MEGVYREKRPYYKVRYPFGKEYLCEVQPDVEGETFRYVFGTSYTPMELTILNTQIKGPNWVTVNKAYLNESANRVESGICAEIQDAEML